MDIDVVINSCGTHRVSPRISSVVYLLDWGV